MSDSKTILVVEDDQDILFAVSTFLEVEGYNVITAENGQVALERLEPLRDSLPHLILLDMKMPVMDGWQFAAQFDRRFDRKAPIVVMTAAADAAQRAHEVNAVGWIGKPFSLDNLMGIIKEHQRDAG